MVMPLAACDDMLVVARSHLLALEPPNRSGGHSSQTPVAVAVVPPSIFRAAPGRR
jgi:hypothetical protein